MNIEQFKQKYATLRDVDKVFVDDLCDCEHHVKTGKEIAKGPAKKNILKHGGEKFVCRDCHMKYDNPMNYVGQGRQTDEEITVYCPCEDHEGESGRQMKKACYYGAMSEPYLQVCGSCAQRGKVISEDQKEAIRLALTGIKRSDEFKQKLRDYMTRNPEGIARATENLVPGAGAGWNEGLKMPEETCQKMSASHTGKIFTEEHRQNISEGRKKMLAETGGFTRAHREAISRATLKQYAKGFKPEYHHHTGWHDSPKAGKVFYRSGYEKKAYIELDADNDVKTYVPEGVTVEYFNPVKQITSSYIIDLLVEYVDGSKKLVEVKPAKWCSDDVVKAKFEAAAIKAQEMGLVFEVWTELELFGPVYNEKHLRSFSDKLKNGEI